MLSCSAISSFFFFNDTATTEIYTLSLHDALPISPSDRRNVREQLLAPVAEARGLHRAHLQRATQLVDHQRRQRLDRKSTRLNSSHLVISYAVFCLKKKNKLPPARTVPSGRVRAID